MASPLKGGTGKFILAVAVIFVPLMILSDFSPQMTLLIAVAAALLFVFKFGPDSLQRWFP